MKQNMGTVDRALRIGSGLALIGLSMNRNNGIMGLVLPLVGGMLLVEGLTSYSLMYDRMGINTHIQD
ncbi:MAG TPA: DUF2892 domain-containing protein [Bacillota bacterium]|nr:DUF2892 domain-containing protein [Bacillota bacterium]